MDSFPTHDHLRIGDRTLRLARLTSLEEQGHDISRLPYSLKILLENLLRREDGVVVTREENVRSSSTDPPAASRISKVIPFEPYRVKVVEPLPSLAALLRERGWEVEVETDPEVVGGIAAVEIVPDGGLRGIADRRRTNATAGY